MSNTCAPLISLLMLLCDTDSQGTFPSSALCSYVAQIRKWLTYSFCISGLLEKRLFWIIIAGMSVLLYKNHPFSGQKHYLLNLQCHDVASRCHQAKKGAWFGRHVKGLFGLIFKIICPVQRQGRYSHQAPPN